jgi:hypothetical protein
MKKISAIEQWFFDRNVEGVRIVLPSLSDSERLEVFEQISAGYCKHCGCNNPGCQCWNDE